ncbi:MAG: hydrogenase expression/formation C-terminal domain-containing protein [Burkholderiaceae bacterium]
MDQPRSAAKPFPIPVVAFGPGSQVEDENLDYLTMPQGMATYRAPALPEPEELHGHDGAVRALRAVLAALDGDGPAVVPLAGLDAGELALVNQVLGEGEVSARVLADPARPHLGQALVQESVFAGVWRVQAQASADAPWVDQVEVGAVPRALLQAADEDGRGRDATVPAAPPGVMNAPAILAELAEQRARWRAGEAAHVVNLSLLPVGPDDIGFIDHVLGTGRVLVLSRGYGNCRITDTRVPHTWRVVYYNSQDAVILNAIEVSHLPDVACAAAEDLQDSRERLAEVLAWVAQG